MTELAQLRALVAEDEPAMLSLVARHLRGLGFDVVEASEGDQAWELAQKQKPDLVILDVMMPGMSGWEICKRLKSHGNDGAFQKTGVIMLTGIGENLNDMTSPLFAADAWLNKPFEFAELDDRIRETLARYEKRMPGSEAEEPPSSLPTEPPAPARAAGSTKAAKPKANGTAAKRAKKPARAVAKKLSTRTRVSPKRAAKRSAAKKPAKAASKAKKTAKKASRRRR